jgi:hypothetical protein
MAWLQREVLTLQFRHRQIIHCEDWGKPQKASDRVTRDSVEIQTGHLRITSDSADPNWTPPKYKSEAIFWLVVVVVVMMVVVILCYLHLSVAKSATVFWSPLSSLHRLGQICSRLVNAESCRILGSSLIQSKVSLTGKEQFDLPEE